MTDIVQYNYIKVLNDDRINEKAFCDFKIITDSGSFQVHKCLLGVASDFFKTMFSSNMKEKYSSEVSIQNISFEIMEKILEFVYGNEVRISKRNAQDLFEASNYLQILPLQYCCVEFMKSNISVENVLDYWSFAERYNLTDFLQKCKIFVQENFSILSKRTEFTSIPPESLYDYIECKDDSTPEEVFYEFIVDWVEFDLENRKDFFSRLFKLVQLDKIDKAYVSSEISECDLVLNNPDCLQQIVKSMKSLLSKDQPSQEEKEENMLSNSDRNRSSIDLSSLKSKTMDSKDNPSLESQFSSFSMADFFHSESPSTSKTSRSKPQQKNEPRSHQKNEFILLGGKSASSVIRKHNVASQKWQDLPSGILKVSCAGLASANKTLFVMGGKELDSLKSYNCLYSLALNKPGSNWTRKADMSQRRHSFGCVRSGDLIYVVGGRAHKTEWLSSVESYNIKGDSWRERPSMNYRRAGCCLVELNKFLYVLGGWQSNESFYSSVEVFNGKTWKMGEDMQEKRTDFAAVVLNNEIYAIGGKPSKNKFFSKTVEKFDYHSGSWNFVASLNIPRSGHGACVLQGKIFVAGGVNHKGEVKPMEMYDPKSDEWKRIANISGGSEDLAMVTVV